tara:strand:+ start:334 stop:666 length:333 start_codon:yes stop_codon:yes gene_type:complete
MFVAAMIFILRVLYIMLLALSLFFICHYQSGFGSSFPAPIESTKAKDNIIMNLSIFDITLFLLGNTCPVSGGTCECNDVCSAYVYENSLCWHDAKQNLALLNMASYRAVL